MCLRHMLGTLCTGRNCCLLFYTCGWIYKRCKKFSVCSDLHCKSSSSYPLWNLDGCISSTPDSAPLNEFPLKYRISQFLVRALLLILEGPLVCFLPACALHCWTLTNSCSANRIADYVVIQVLIRWRLWERVSWEEVAIAGESFICVSRYRVHIRFVW